MAYKNICIGLFGVFLLSGGVVSSAAQGPDRVSKSRENLENKITSLLLGGVSNLNSSEYTQLREIVVRPDLSGITESELEEKFPGKSVAVWMFIIQFRDLEYCFRKAKMPISDGEIRERAFIVRTKIDEFLEEKIKT